MVPKLRIVSTQTARNDMTARQSTKAVTGRETEKRGKRPEAVGTHEKKKGQKGPVAWLYP